MVKLVAVTKGVNELADKNAQDVLSYVARVSNPNNQTNFETGPKLLAYCIKNNHWSVFEHAYMTLEIETSRAIAAQILRHRSFVFQEFSQRYQVATEFVYADARRQDTKNRQNSIDDLSPETKDWFEGAQTHVMLLARQYYEAALESGIARECARMLLPQSTKTRLYMTGNVRSWITYFQTRCGNGTQLEHQQIANECKTIFCEQLPDVAKALGWINESS